MSVFDNELQGLPWWLRQQRICLQCRILGFNPWVRKIPWRQEWQPTPIFLLGEFHGQRKLVGYCPRESQRVTHTHTHTHTLQSICIGDLSANLKLSPLLVTPRPTTICLGTWTHPPVVLALPWAPSHPTASCLETQPHPSVGQEPVDTR